MTSSGPAVRDAVFDVLRERGLTTVFANPGSTEVTFLGGLPDDFRFVLALHEGALVGMASGYAIGSGEPAFVLVHTTAGLGNAVSALATARVNRAPLVVLIGQQDRRHLAQEPFLAGRLHGLAGEYPVWVDQPARPQDVPGALARAWHEARTARGPALVIVPMDDWLAPAGEAHEIAAPARLVPARAAEPAAIAELADLIEQAAAPVLVVGAGADDPDAWAALVELAERLACPVWQEAFGARAGFPQDHPRFAGHLPAGRRRLREALAPHDLVLAVGAPVFRQYPYEPGPLVEPGTRIALVTDDPAEAHRSPVDLAVLAAPAGLCAELVRVLPEPAGAAPKPMERPATPEPPAEGQPLRAAHLLAALAERLPPDTVLVEEAPSSRPELMARLPARQPLGFLSAAMGGLGFGLSAPIGVRMAQPSRPVVAVVGDGSAMYAIQALWSAVRYEVGAIFVVIANGGYRVMDRLAEAQDEAAPWPAFGAIDITAIAKAQGCPARRVETFAELEAALDEALDGIGERREPMLLEMVVAPDREFLV
jgi:thiamine pyrophosphate-dependent acetolactate synthase large subunit-like protein